MHLALILSSCGTPTLEVQCNNSWPCCCARAKKQLSRGPCTLALGLQVRNEPRLPVQLMHRLCRQCPLSAHTQRMLQVLLQPQPLAAAVHTDNWLLAAAGADMVVGIAGSAPPEVLARTIGVLGRLQFADQLVLDELQELVRASVGQELRRRRRLASTCGMRKRHAFAGS